jgi:hypothetical protein
MALYSADTELSYRPVTAAQVPLTPALAKTIFSFQKSRRESLHHLCLIAYGLRRSNLQKIKPGKRGGNAQGQILSDAFKVWYKREKMKDVYGGDSNFITYAMCGRLLSYTRWQLDAKKGSNLIEKLPVSLGTMYELSKILWTQGGTTIPEGRNIYLRLLTTITDDGSPPPTLINPQLTRSDLIKIIQGPQKGNLPRGRKNSLGAASTEEVPRDLLQMIGDAPVLASITIKPTCFSFSKNGNPKGASTEEVNVFAKELDVLIRRYAKHFQISSNLKAVISKIEEAANPDFGKNIQ